MVALTLSIGPPFPPPPKKENAKKEITKVAISIWGGASVYPDFPGMAPGGGTKECTDTGKSERLVSESSTTKIRTQALQQTAPIA